MKASKKFILPHPTLLLVLFATFFLSSCPGTQIPFAPTTYPFNPPVSNGENEASPATNAGETVLSWETNGVNIGNLENALSSGARMLRNNSGMTVSLKNPAYLWFIDDASSNRNRVFLVEKSTGNRVARYNITNSGYSVPQVEDLAIGRDPDGTPYLYLCATGNNAMSAPEGKIVRFEEPLPQALGDNAEITTPVKIIRFLLPTPWGTAATADCETLLFDPATRDLIYVMKSMEDDKYLHRLLHNDYKNADNTLVTLHQSPAKTVLYAPFKNSATNVPGNPSGRDPGFMNLTGGSVSADGSFIALIGYWDFFIWKSRSGESVFEALQRKPDHWFVNHRQILGSENNQREGIAWEADGSAFYSCREQSGSHPPIYRFDRINP